MRAQASCVRARSVVALAILLSIPVAARTAGSVPSIDNFGTVNERYYRGAQPTGRAYADLAAAGVKLVIDLQEAGDRSEPAFVERAGMKYVRIPMNTRIAPTPEQVGPFLQLVSDPANHPVSVPCARGPLRPSAQTAGYRITLDRCPADRASQTADRSPLGP